MNVILGELKKAGIDHKKLDDVFRFAESLVGSCEFFRQPGESRLRVLDLASSLFDHVAAECIENVISLGIAGEENEESDGSDGSEIDSEEETQK